MLQRGRGVIFHTYTDLNIRFPLNGFETLSGQICAANVATESRESRINDSVVGENKFWRNNDAMDEIGFNRWNNRLLEE